MFLRGGRLFTLPNCLDLSRGDRFPHDGGAGCGWLSDNLGVSRALPCGAVHAGLAPGRDGAKLVKLSDNALDGARIKNNTSKHRLLDNIRAAKVRTNVGVETKYQAEVCKKQKPLRREPADQGAVDNHAQIIAATAQDQIKRTIRTNLSRWLTQSKPL